MSKTVSKTLFIFLIIGLVAGAVGLLIPKSNVGFAAAVIAALLLFAPLFYFRSHTLSKEQKAVAQAAARRYEARHGLTKAVKVEQQERSKFGARCLCWLFIFILGVRLAGSMVSSGWRFVTISLIALAAIPPAAILGHYLWKAKNAFFRPALQNLGLEPTDTDTT